MLTKLKRFALRLITFWRLQKRFSKLAQDQILDGENQSIALIDVFDLHPVAVARNLNIINGLLENGVRPVVFQRSWRLSRISSPEASIFWVIYELALTRFLYRKYQNLEISFVARDPELEKSCYLEDLLLDGVMRFEQKARISDVDPEIFAKHAMCAVSIYKSIDEFLSDQSPVVCVSGHKTYYLRGILYRLAGLKGIGLYVGPRFNSLITKRLTPSNYNDCLDFVRAEEDYFPGFGGLSKTEPWLKAIRDSQVKVPFTSPYDGRYPLLAFHCWVDDNFKGKFNIFEGHFSAALEMAEWLSEKNIPFLYKFHPHNGNYGVAGYNAEFEKYTRERAIKCLNVSGLDMSNLAESVSLVVTGNGSIGPEARELGLPFLCYADPPYYVAGEWAYCASKDTFLQKLVEHREALLSATKTNLHKYYNLAYENSADPCFLSKTDAKFFNEKKMQLGIDWGNDILAWYFNVK